MPTNEVSAAMPNQWDKPPPDIRTLCCRCRDDYIDAGYSVIRIEKITVKMCCDKCSYRSGWCYIIKKQGGKRAAE